MKILRKSDTVSSSGKKLSTFGKGIVAAFCIIFIIIIILIIVAVNGSRSEKEKMNELENAISYAIQTCKNSVLNNTDALTEINKYENDIKKTKKANEKVKIILEAIQYTLSKTVNTQAIDELNGSRNRVNLAYKNYQS